MGMVGRREGGQWRILSHSTVIPPNAPRVVRVLLQVLNQRLQSALLLLLRQQQQQQML